MYKIALINPPSPFLTNQRVFPNMGIVRVATSLAEEHNVKVIDLAGVRNYLKAVRDIANDFDYYAFSSTSAQFPYTYRIFKELKAENPKAKTIIGGPHASAISSLRRKGIEDINIKTLDEFDTIFDGEGEDITNLFKPGWQRARIEMDIDKFPIPDRSFIDLKSYKYNLLGEPTTSIQTQRGCPFQCKFCCGRDIDMYRKVRTHSPERVVEEMDLLNEQYGYKSFMWYDDEININPKRLSKLCKLLAERPYQHRGFIRSDLVVRHPETIKMLKDAGFVKLCTGVESGSDKILKNIGKGVTSEENLKARQIIKDAGIHYEAFLMMGLPGETKHDVELSVNWMKRAKPDDFDVCLMVPYPGSKIYDEAIKSNKFKGFEWEYNGLYFQKPDYSKVCSYYKGLGGKAEVHSRTDDMTEEYLKQRRKEIQCQFKK